MILKLNTTGTHTHKGLLKLRVDVYPSIGDATYSMHHVPDIPEGATDEQVNDPSWVSALPKKLNPALCHFFTVPEDFSLEDVEEYLRNLFDPDTWATLDNYLAVPNSMHYVSPYMKGKEPLSRDKIVTRDIGDLIESSNTKLASVKEIELTDSGNTEPITPESIDIGNEAIDRSTNAFIYYYTILVLDNPANASGTLDTIQIFPKIDVDSLKAATFYGSNPYSTRDYEACGDAAGGSTVTFSGLDIDVEAGDYLGGKSSSGRVEADTGGSGAYKYGDQIPCTDVTFTSCNWEISLYGTGTESGGTTEKTSSDSGAGLDTNISGSPVVTAAGTETGVGNGVKSDYPGGGITAAETGDGTDTASLAGVITPAGDGGSGVESSTLDTGEAVVKAGSDSGAGIEIAGTAAIWTGSDSGFGTEDSVVVPVFFAGDTGMGVESGVLIKDAYGADRGDGEDILKALVGAGGKSADMRLHGGSGKAGIPSRQARIPSEEVDI